MAFAVPRTDPQSALTVFVLGAAVEAFRTNLYEGVYLSLTNVVAFALILVAGPAAAVIASVGAGLSTIRGAETQRIAKAIFNVGQYALAALAAGSIFWAIAPGEPGSTLPFYGEMVVLALVGLAVSGVVYTLVNGGLVAAIVSASGGVSFRENVRSIGETLTLQFFYIGLAAVLAILLQEAGAIALLLLAVPLLIARQALLAFQKKKAAYDRLVGSFVKILEVKDGYTRGHADRVAELAEAVATEFGMDYDTRRGIRYGALLHDIGKINVSAQILCKDGPLTDEEFDLIRAHPERGTEIIGDVRFLEPALEVVRHHHERWDGRGYPDGLAGEDIPLAARIVTATDAFDAMTSTRSYRPAMGISEALDEMRRHAERQFDPAVVTVLARIVDELDWTVTDEPVRTIAAEPASVTRSR